MKSKFNIIFISLIMLVLLSMTFVSATQDLDANSTLKTDDFISEEVISSPNVEEIEVRSTVVELENNDSALEADGDNAFGKQVESNNVEFENNDFLIVVDCSNDVLGSSNDFDDGLVNSVHEDLLGKSYGYRYIYGYPVLVNYDYPIKIYNIHGDFDNVNKEMPYIIKSAYLFLQNEYGTQLNLVSSGNPLIFRGGSSTLGVCKIL